MHKLSRAIAPLFLAAAVAFCPATPAQAADTSVEISNLKATNLVVKSSKCVYGDVSLDYAVHDESLTEFHGILALGNLWHAGKNTGIAVIFAETDATAGTAPGEYEWCPGDGFGTFKVSDLVGAYGGMSGSEEVFEEFSAPNTTTFTVKMGTKFTSAKVTKKGKTRTISAKSTYFDTGSKAWKSLAKGTKVQLQRQAAAGTGDWKSIKTVKVGSKGAVKTTYKTSTTYRYRFAYVGTSTKAPSFSSTLKK